MHGVQHQRMTNVFDERITTQGQEWMELKPKDLENAADWYAWSFNWDGVSIDVEKLHTLVEVWDDKLVEKEAFLSKSNMIDQAVQYHERKQALLFSVDSFLSLTNEKKQRQSSRSVTEWEEGFGKMESS